MASGPPQTQNPSKSRPVQTKPFTNPNNNPIPGTPEYAAFYGKKTGSYTIGGVTYDIHGNPIRSSQIANTAANRKALDDAGLKYTSAGQNIFTNSQALQDAINGGYVQGAASTSIDPNRPNPEGYTKDASVTNQVKDTFASGPATSKDWNDLFLNAKIAGETEKNLKQKAKNQKAEQTMQGGGVETPQSKGLSFGWGSDQIARNSNAEKALGASEAARAEKYYGNFSKPDYASGGQPLNGLQAFVMGDGKISRENFQKSSDLQGHMGGPETPQSDLFMEQTRGQGFGQRAKGQNIRNTNAEQALMVSEANRAMEKEREENVSFSTFQPTAPSVKASKVGSTPNSKPINFDVFPAKEQSFNDYVSSSAAKGATIDILVNNIVVGSVKGPNALSSIMSYETKHPNQQFSVLATYPEREQELTQAVQKDAGTYLKMPQSYWNNLAKQGYLSQKNVNQVNTTLQLESTLEFRKQVSEARSKAEVDYLLEPENEVASFLRIPYSGSKVSTPWGNYTLAGGRKYSTSNIPSTSLANVLQFLPGLGSGLLGKASIELEKIVTKAEPSLLKTGIDLRNKVSEPLQKKVLFESPLTNVPKNFKKLPVSNEIEVRNRPTYRATNPTRISLPTDIYARDTGEGIRPFSETPSEKLPVNSFNPRTGARARMIGEENAQTTSAYNKMMNDLLKPKPEEPSSNAPRNISFFHGRTTASGKPYTGNLSPIRLFNPSRESVANVQPKAAGLAPTQTFTQPEIFVGGKPEGENLQYFYAGTLPKSYVPQASTAFGFLTEPPQPELINPLGRRGVPPVKTSYPEDLIQTRASVVEETTPSFFNEVFTSKGNKLSGVFGETQTPKGALTRSGIVINNPKAPEEINILGRRGKPPINKTYEKSNPFDFLQEPRAERVSNRVFYEYPLSSSGKRLSPSEAANEGGLFGALRPIQPRTRPPIKLTRPSPPEGTIFKGFLYKGTAPVYSSVYKFSEYPSDIKEFFGLTGERVTPTKYAGKLPLESYGYVAQKAFKEGEPAFFDLEKGTIKRAYSSKAESTGRAAPLDIFSEEISGKSIFSNAKGAKYYQSESVYDMGKTFVRGSLQTKDVGLIKFEKYQEKHPPEPEIGAKGVWSDLEKSLPKNYRKSSVFSTDFKEVKSGKSSSTSANLFKPVEKKPEVKGTEFKNTGSKTETILIRKPLVKKNLITDNTLATDYNFEYARTPPSKEGGTISMTLGTKSGSIFKYGPKLAPGQKSKTGLSEILKSPTRTKELPDLLHGPKLGQDQTPRLTPKQTPKNIPKILQTPKQTSTPKQTPKHTPKTPTPQIPKFSTDISPMFTPANVSRIPPPPPKKGPPPPLPNWGFPFQGKRPKGASGPTGILNLDVHNPFTSSFSIKIKGNRIEF